MVDIEIENLEDARVRAEQHILNVWVEEMLEWKVSVFIGIINMR